MNKEISLEEYQKMLKRFEDWLRFHVTTSGGKIVIDSLTGKPLVKFCRGKNIEIDLNNPDFAIEQLEERYKKYRMKISCSRCHHCR